MSCHVMPCHAMPCHARSGQARSGQVGSGRVGSGQVRSGQVRSECLTYTFKGRKMFLFNDALNTFYLRLYCVRHNYGKGPLSELLFPISSKGSFICITPTDSIAHTTAFVTPVVEHWLER